MRRVQFLTGRRRPMRSLSAGAVGTVASRRVWIIFSDIFYSVVTAPVRDRRRELTPTPPARSTSCTAARASCTIRVRPHSSHSTRLGLHTKRPCSAAGRPTAADWRVSVESTARCVRLRVVKAADRSSPPPVEHRSTLCELLTT